MQLALEQTLGVVYGGTHNDASTEGICCACLSACLLSVYFAAHPMHDAVVLPSVRLITSSSNIVCGCAWQEIFRGAGSAHTQYLHMQEEVCAPAAVRAVDLVDAVWPAGEEPRPQVLPAELRRSCYLCPIHPGPPQELIMFWACSPRNVLTVSWLPMAQFAVCRT